MSKKQGYNTGELMVVLVIFAIGALIIQVVGGNAWSLSKALGVPDWMVWAACALILLGGVSSKKEK